MIERTAGAVSMQRVAEAVWTVREMVEAEKDGDGTPPPCVGAAAEGKILKSQILLRCYEKDCNLTCKTVVGAVQFQRVQLRASDVHTLLLPLPRTRKRHTHTRIPIRTYPASQLPTAQKNIGM